MDKYQAFLRRRMPNNPGFVKVFMELERSHAFDGKTAEEKIALIKAGIVVQRAALDAEPLT